jgi:prepilin-type processing-associated H-X9-DG protein
VFAERGRIVQTNPPTQDQRTGISLLEILVTIAIIGLLVGITIPAVQRVRETAARSACQANLRQLALATHLYADSKGVLPKGCDYPFLITPRDLDRQCGISWQTSILPFLEQASLWQTALAANQNDPAGVSEAHDAVRERWLSVMICPSDGRQIGGRVGIPWWGLTSYRGVAGTRHAAEDGCFHQNNTVRFAHIQDGSSSTLLIGERPSGPQGRYGGWYAGWGSSVCHTAQLLPVGRDAWLPSDSRNCPPATAAFRAGRMDDICDVNHFWSPHSGGANFAFADGSVRFLRYSADPIMPALASRAGGEAVAVPE